MQGGIFYNLLLGKLLGFFPNFSLQAPSQVSLKVEFWTGLYQFAGLCQGCIFDNLLFWIIGLKVFSRFFITSCNVFFTSTTLEHFFTVGLMFFPLWWENLYVCGHSVPFFIVFSAMSFLYGFSFGLFIYQSARGVYFTTNCFGTLLWTFFPSFPSQAVECYFIKY